MFIATKRTLKSFCEALAAVLFLGLGSQTANASLLQPDKVTVKGKVTDTSGNPIPGAILMVPGTSTYELTDLDGNYSISAEEGSKVEVSTMGFKTTTFTVGPQKTVNIALEDESTTLDDAVVVAYGTQRKATVTGSVTAVNTKDLLQSPQANISNALAGRMSGLLSVQRSGEPGHDESTLRIRGVGTFSGDSDPLIMVDGIESTTYNNIDPNEIESITILKDASATAVYGVRGANGVLLINTKRGSLGRPQVSFSSSVAMTNFPFLRENMNSYDWASSYNKALAYDSYITGSYIQEFTEEQIQKYKDGTDPMYCSIDWYDYMLKDFGFQNQDNLNIRGGTDRVKYFFSLGYFTQNGMLDTSIVPQDYDYEIRYHRYNFRSNFDINITKNLQASIDLSMQMDDTRNPNWNTDLLMEMLSSVAPNTSPGYVDGKILTVTDITNSGWTPLIVCNKGWKRNYGTTTNGSVRLNYNMDYLLKGFKLRGTLSYKSYSQISRTFEVNGLSYDLREAEDGSYIYIPSGEKSQVSTGSSMSRNRRIYLEAGAEYNHSFGQHNVGALLLYNQSKYYSPDLEYLVPNGYQGIVGRVTYDYAGRYMAEFNVGYNGTENFAEGHRFGWFPSASAGWVITDEKWLPKNQWLTFLKFRISYGIVGNDKVGGDRFLYRPTSYSYYSGAYRFGEVQSSYNAWRGSDEGKIGNPDLTWEKAKKFNVGVDSHFFSDRLGITFDWFLENRDNILCNRGTVPAIIGANMPAYNLGKMRNSGYEGEITWSDTYGGFRLNIKGTYTYAHNVILEEDEVAWEDAYRYRTGQRYGQFYGYVADGIFNTWEEVNDVNRPVYQWNNNKIQPGDIRYVDINGDGRIDDADQVPIGYSNFPEIMFGLSIGGEYKGFDFSVLFQGATHVSTIPSRRTSRGFYTKTGASQDLLKSWSYERYTAGEEIVYPRFSVTNDTHNYVTSTYWVEDASYVRVKTAEIGYTLRGTLLKKAGISSCRIYLNGNNLLTFCKLYPGEDPEYRTMSANEEPYPLTRTFNLGVNLNF